MLPLLALALASPFLFLAHVLYAYFANPLRRIPAAHALAPFTSLWILSVRWRSIENATLKAAHDKLGPIVCLGPNEISVNCVRGGIKDVYTGGFEKGNGTWGWYEFFENFGGTPNMFSTSSNKIHSARKRMLSNIYSKSVVVASPALFAQTCSIIYHRFLPALASTLSSNEPGVLHAYPVLNGATMDIVTSYIFGLASGSKLLLDPGQLAWFLDLYNSRRCFNFWPQELPGLTSMLRRWFGYRLVPAFVDTANTEIEKWTRNMCDRSAAVLGQSDVDVKDTPVVYQQLSAALSKEAKKSGGEKTDVRRHAASEVLDHLAAGFDTSGITLVYVVHELSMHPDIQARLHAELLTLSPPILPSSAPTLPDPKTVEALPLLHAVIWETLRLHSAIPGAQPRFTPAQGCRLGPEDQSYFVPGGVRVSASAGLLHANEQVYERAEEWRPDRWLNLESVGEEKRRDMESRWFWAFGSGGRMCVGSHLAVYQMKYIVAAMYSNYTTKIVNDMDIEQSDAYTAPPRSDKLMIELVKHVKTG
ncbi:cytochrome P450 [Pleomassaria siparia CBS 279.74]|uniref:Cytochrome P450 n=1 Tax=Pleomassaria siparia CBS 279.74 TaxID=1314801 RepID=A0A6G1K0E5_9PLEO|nr:cytochrome P450 [Pleomassaria siparia CBS 279.74]